MIRAVRIALIAISRNGLRAALTVLGILIGVAAVVVTTALGSGARDNVASQIQSIGSNLVIIFPENARVSGARGLSGSGPRLTEDDGRAIAREAVSISHVAPANRARAQVVRVDKNVSTSVVGSTLAFFPVRNWAVARGSAWTEGDETLKSKVCVLGTTVQKNLFGTEDPVGQTVRIGRYPYRILGVLESKGEAPFGGDQDDVVVMPIGSMRARVQRTSPGFAGVLMMSATSAETTDRAVAQADRSGGRAGRLDPAPAASRWPRRRG
jgi:putative ABC transport system permease protein